MFVRYHHSPCLWDFDYVMDRVMLSSSQAARQDSVDLWLDALSRGMQALKDFVKEAIAAFGQVDVLINNAGYLLSEAIEENTPEEIPAQFETTSVISLTSISIFATYMINDERAETRPSQHYFTRFSLSQEMPVTDYGFVSLIQRSNVDRIRRIRAGTRTHFWFSL
ncbi:hypothetical protein D9758_004489 [Tetrapyrgos nigripes]|uniref:Uncharacterized protein n=1 Tax=Tetrapyrgos nigripes TaxID=182062 RepID=A0A8H5GNG0_9AGAR|nr:hypothetical protein D9758_004489 [Tetrapyrgos nigripes]